MTRMHNTASIVGLKILAVLILAIATAQKSYSQEFSFAGSVSENQGELYYMTFRYYDPETGTFLSRDPLGSEGDINKYGYVNSNPVNFIDPLGLMSVSLVDEFLEIFEFKLEVGATAEIKLNLGPVGTIGGDINIISFGGQSELLSNIQNVASTGGSLNLVIGNLGNGNQLFSGHIIANVEATNSPVIEGDLGQVVITQGANVTLGPNFLGASVGTVTQTTIDFNNNTVTDQALTVTDVKIGGSYGAGLVATFNINVTQVGDFLGAVTGELLFSDSYGNTPFDPDVLQPLEDYFPAGMGGSAFDIPISDRAFNNLDQLNVGGVLIDLAATLIGANISDILGAVYDPVSNQIVFLGNDSDPTAVDDNLDMDYFFTAVQAVYGSAVPPFVTLDPPVSLLTEWTDYTNGDNVFENGESGGVIIKYNPIWAEEDTTIDVRFRASEGGQNYDFSARFNAVADYSIQAGGRPLMRLEFDQWTTIPPSGISLDVTPFELSLPPFGLNLGPDHQTTFYPVTLEHAGSQNLIINDVYAIPAKQHRRFGGRVDATKLGWVMFEADRVMKALGVGVDNIVPNTFYNNSTLSGSVPGFQNLKERLEATGTSGGFARMWFVPNEMTLKRHVDSDTEQATIVFDQATVALRTESFLLGQPQPPVARDFADHFNAHYDEYAAIDFPVYDPFPADPANPGIIYVKIFDMLRDVMKAVSLARFFRDNDIPLDMWWLNSWDFPFAYSPKSVPTAFFEEDSGGSFFLIYGGVEILKPNDYVPSPTAMNVGQTVAASRPDIASNPDGDIDEQLWTATVDLGQGNEDLTAISGSMNTNFQDGNISLVEVDLNYASPGSQPLQIARYYQSSYLGKQHLGPGWRNTRYVLEFQRPSWFDENSLMRDENGNPLWTDLKGDSRLRSGIIRMVDLASGGALYFKSSLNLDYGLDSWGNPIIQLTGLNINNVPDFSPLQQQNGSTLTQLTTGSTYDYLLQTPDGAELLFDSEGRLLSTSDRHNYTQQYAYDTDNCLISITDDASQVVSLFYDDTLQLEYVTGPAGERVDYTYYTSGCLKTATHERSGATVTYDYNSNNQLKEKFYYNGFRAFSTTPELRGRSDLTQDIRGNILDQEFSIESQTLNHVTETTDPQSSFGSSHQVFDQNGRLISSENPLNAVATFDYTDDSLLPNEITPPIPNRPAISISRNEFGQATVIDDPANINASPIQISYSTTNKPERHIDSNGEITDFHYNTDDDLDWITRHLGGQEVKTTFGYENGYLKTITDPLNNTITYERDSLGRLEFIIDATLVTTQYEYDALGRLWKIHDPRLSSPIIHVYDNFDRVFTITTSDGTMTYNYDPQTGFLESVVDQLNRVTRYEYYPGTKDLQFLIKEIPLQSDVVTEFKYDRFGNISEIIPPGAQTVKYNYDDLGRLTGTEETDGTVPGAPKALDSDNADDGVWTKEVDHIFLWGAPDSDVGIAGYSFAFDVNPDETIDTTSGTATVLGVNEGTHTFKVKAQSNSDIWGDTAIFDLKVDVTNPSINNFNLSPSNVTVYSTGVANVTVTITDALSGIPVDSPKLRWCFSNDASRPWNDYSVMTSLGSDQWSFNIPAVWMQEGDMTLYYQVQVADAAGNQIVSAEQSELVDKPLKPILIYSK